MTMKQMKKKIWKIGNATEFVAVRDRYNTGDPKIVAHHLHAATPQGEFFLKCVERWAMVAAEVDGEDTAGRQKFRRLTAAELCDHARECTKVAFTIMDREGWLPSVPSYEEVCSAVEDSESNS